MIEIAGGTDVLGVAGTKSRTAEWDEIAASNAEVVVAMPCGWDATQARSEVDDHAAEIAAIGAERIWTVDAAASFSRPGPRLVEGTELLAHLLHPDRVDPPEVGERALEGEAGERPVRWLRVKEGSWA
jgi:iron complex transport system substrate-binding protein